MRERIDPYGPIHKVIRSLMGGTVYRLGRTDYSQARESAETLTQLEQTLEFMIEHSQVEDRSYHPTLAAKAQGVADTLSSEHERVEHALSAVRKLGQQVREMELGAERNAAGHQLYLQFAKVVAEYTLHLHTEETLGKAAFQAFFTDAEILETQARMRTEMGPERMGKWAPHMIAPMNHFERLTMLSSMRRLVPPHVFRNVLELAARTLSESDFKRLEVDLEAMATDRN